MADRFCQECGERNAETATTCSRCGAVLKAGIPPAAAVPAYGSPAYGPQAYGPPAYGPPAYAYPAVDYAAMARAKQVDRTKWGVLVLAVGFLITWIPNFVTGCLGLVFFLAGIILMALGRRAFGPRHATFVVVGILLIVAYIVGFVILSIWFVVVIFSMAGSGSLQGIGSTIWTYLIAGSIVGVLQAAAPVLLGHQLSRPAGKVLLYAGFGASIVLQAVILIVIAPTINAVIAALEGGPITDPLDPRIAALSNLSSSLTLAGVVPFVLFAGAFFLAFQRISRGEIPASRPAPPAPAWAPASPPVPPPPPPAPASPPGEGPPPAPPPP